MKLEYDFIDFEIDTESVKDALVEIIAERYSIAVVAAENIIVENDLESNDAFIEHFEDELKDWFHHDAREYYNDCVADTRYKQSFDYGAVGTFGD